MLIRKENFHAYDIRGVYGSEIGEDFAYALGRALPVFLKEKKGIEAKAILVNRDVRAVSEPLMRSLIKGLLEGGVSIFDGGISTSPMHYFAVGSFDVQAGVMVTPSHGAPGTCGFKISTKTERIASDTGLLDVYEIMQKPFAEPGHVGTLRELDILPQYAMFLQNQVHIPAFGGTLRVAIDASAGAAGKVLERLLPSMRIEAAKLFFDADPDVRTHGTNPLKPESQQFVKEEIQKNYRDLGVVFDGDGDRAVFFDEYGREIPSDYVAALIAEEKLRSAQYRTILLDVNASRKSVEYIEGKKGVVKRARVGTAFFRNELEHDKSVLLGSESSGHYYYPEMFGNDGAILTFIYLVNIRASRGMPLSHLIAPFLATFRSGELNFSVADKEGAVRRVQEAFPDGTISTIDGLMVEYPDWRFTVRPSNTEDLVRVHVEADSQELLDRGKSQLEALLK